MDATAKKKDLVSNWERIFEKKVDEVINEAGFRWLWDTDTSVNEVIELLDAAAVNEAIGVVNDMFEHIFGDYEDEEPEQEEPKGTCADKYRVINISNPIANFVGSTDDVFDTVEDAYMFREQKALSTALSLNDMRVIKVS